MKKKKTLKKKHEKNSIIKQKKLAEIHIEDYRKQIKKT